MEKIAGSCRAGIVRQPEDPAAERIHLLGRATRAVVRNGLSQDREEEWAQRAPPRSRGASEHAVGFGEESLRTARSGSAAEPLLLVRGSPMGTGTSPQTTASGGGPGRVTRSGTHGLLPCSSSGTRRASELSVRPALIQSCDTRPLLSELEASDVALQ